MLDAVNNVLGNDTWNKESNSSSTERWATMCRGAAGLIPGAACSIDAKSTRFSRELVRNPDDVVQ
jgi:hypothetical protein